MERQRRAVWVTTVATYIFLDSSFVCSSSVLAFRTNLCSASLFFLLLSLHFVLSCFFFSFFMDLVLAYVLCTCVHAFIEKSPIKQTTPPPPKKKKNMEQSVLKW